MTDTEKAEKKAIDLAIACAESENWQGAVAWSNIALAVVQNNHQAVLQELGITAALWLDNPTPEGFAAFEQTVALYRKINN